jgi:hypothetical protein
MNTKKNSTQLPFESRKKIGQSVEREFMELIALMGGTAQSLGTVPSHSDPTPRFCRPHETAEDGFHYSVSPDILFTLPDQPRGFASLAQVKLKKVYSERAKGWLFVYLDQSELHRMTVAAGFYDVFFVIHTPELTEQPEFSDWLWLNVDLLKKTELIRRTIGGKKTFLLPLNLFQPLSTLKKEPLNEPANDDPARKDASL